jgi:hypothetical protein
MLSSGAEKYAEMWGVIDVSQKLVEFASFIIP